MTTQASIIGTGQAVSRGVYGRWVADAAAVPQDFLLANVQRIDRAYAAGEPIWMIADELKVVFTLRRPPTTKAPRDLALRVVRV